MTESNPALVDHVVFDKAADPVVHRAILNEHKTPDLYLGGKLALLRKAVVNPNNVPNSSNAGVLIGRREHLINKMTARELRDFNTTHATCLDAKISSTVGMGHRDQKIHEVLDPLCHFSWQDVLDAVGNDYWEGGDGYVEVVYAKDSDEIVSLNHIEGAMVEVIVEQENNVRDYHYAVTAEIASGASVLMAPFGGRKALKQRFESGNMKAEGARSAGSREGQVVDSEVIHFRMGTNRSRWYGYPDYLSATPSIELVQCMTQHEFDFYFNRGVPEFLLFLIGNNITKTTWDAITSMLKASQGLGNSHKTGAVQIPGTKESVTVQLEKLAVDNPSETGFMDKSLTLAMQIATSHGVPPILANILLPGKIGASNEGPNALLLLQKRKIGPAQRNFSSILANTLGSGVKLSGGGSLKAEQFLNPMAGKQQDENGLPIFNQSGNGFQTILDGMTLGEAQTLSTMKEPIAGSGRNPADGNLEGADDRKPTDPRKSR